MILWSVRRSAWWGAWVAVAITSLQIAQFMNRGPFIAGQFLGLVLARATVAAAIFAGVAALRNWITKRRA